MANGPKPDSAKPKARCTSGMATKACRRSTVEKIISPMVNSDLVFL